MAEIAPLSPSDRALLADTAYSSCESLADVGQLLTKIIPRYERTAVASDIDDERTQPLPPEVVASLRELIHVDHFYRTNIRFLSQLSTQQLRTTFDNSHLKHTQSGDSHNYLFSRKRWLIADVGKFIVSVTSSSTNTVLLCVQKLLVALLRIHFKLREVGTQTDRDFVSQKLQASQFSLCHALIENAVDARGVHTLLREHTVAALEEVLTKAIEETKAINEALDHKDDERYQLASHELTRDVAAFGRTQAAVTRRNSRVPTLRLTDEELALVVATGKNHPWQGRPKYWTDPLDWLWQHYRPWIGKGLLQTDLRKGDELFYQTLKKRLARGHLPDWVILPSKSEIRHQEAVDRNDVDGYQALKAVSRVRSRLQRGRMQHG